MFETKVNEIGSSSSGVNRDTTEGKTDWSLVADGPMLQRWAELLTRAVPSHGKRNWMLAAAREDYDRFRESAFRHFMDWYLGKRDEDHGAGVFFNINGAEYVRDKMVTTAQDQVLRDQWKQFAAENGLTETVGASPVGWFAPPGIDCTGGEDCPLHGPDSEYRSATSSRESP